LLTRLFELDHIKALVETVLVLLFHFKWLIAIICEFHIELLVAVYESKQGWYMGDDGFYERQLNVFDGSILLELKW
jgi:hypothetical protein